ncbi:hypothetical protein HG535_0G03970 [Zygotorulaspora mrakii]|uniref:Branchpoint-bridging protein n=1 Tax=Zygotorulaspora mrakii TaxID=42260 RepID=A0A7H9B8E1_ZYGMR|nr:uncharacterized protein HG535_0G03970 [Zygotorulaspora mrakii]QLG74514.1 hypothetical protein HG535_0G03970 [Zygotorulaspora mrakii]
MDPRRFEHVAHRGRRIERGNVDLRGPKGAERARDTMVQLPTRLAGALTQEQLSAYQTMFRIQEVTAELRSSDIRPPQKRNRSPSPPPAYDTRGKRINTREHRYRRKLEEERHRLVEIVLKMLPHFVAPEDYKRPVKFQDKYYIPVSQYPGINFVGLLLGPRGNTLKKLQEDSGCKIAIRGRGSVKEGKNAHDLPKGAMNFSDPLHCLIIADSEEKIQKGIKVCENIVVRAVTSPEGQNDLKRGQLRELAELNGTLREDKRPCNACGLQGHKNYECPSAESVPRTVQCRNCGQQGHVTNDCVEDNYQQTQVTQSGRYNRYTDTREFSSQDRKFDVKGHNKYNSFGGNLPSPLSSSYKSRFTRTTADQSSFHGYADKYDYGRSDLSQSTHGETGFGAPPPPGMDSQIDQSIQWAVPGMTLSNSVKPLSKPDTLPPGMNLQPSSAVPGADSELEFQALHGPPGLASEEDVGAPEDLQKPPGL